MPGPDRAGGPVPVLWLTKGLGRGGTESLLAACARHVSRDRYAVEVAYVLPWKDGLVPELTAAGVPVHCLADGGERGGWPLRLRRLVRERGYAIVHTHAPVPAVAARILLDGTSRLVHTEHNLWPRYRRPTRWANALTYRRNAAVIAVSHAVANTITPRPWSGRNPPVTVVVHGIDREAVAPRPGGRPAARQLLGVGEDAFVVGSVGNLTPKKDHRTLIDALARLRRREDAVLVLVGTGPLEDELRRYASGLGLGAAVVFAGLRTDVPDLLPGFDVFASSSRYEGLPVAVMEAFAAGLPVVATSVGGVPELVTHGREGLLVPPGDPAALADALAMVAGDDSLRARLAANGVERAQTLDVAAAQRRIEEVYSAVLAETALAREAP